MDLRADHLQNRYATDRTKNDNARLHAQEIVFRTACQCVVATSALDGLEASRSLAGSIRTLTRPDGSRPSREP